MIEDAVIRLILLALMLLSMGVGTAQEAPAPDMSAALRNDLQALETYTQWVRGLQPQAPLIRRFPTRVEVEAYIEEAFRTELTDEVLAEDVRFYAAFGLMPRDTDLRAVLTRLYQDQVAGFYDTESKEMNVILLSGGQPGDRLPLLEQIVYVHEYVHVLQDQNFGLADLLERATAEGNRDRGLALLALVEGDATAVMNLYTQRAAESNPLAVTLEVLQGGIQVGNLTLPPDVPDIIGDELLWPYEAGSVFVAALVRAGGWQAVDDAFTLPPLSTEQILHPEKYLAGEAPIRVRMTDAAQALGADWQLVEAATLGEYYISHYLDAYLDRRVAREAAAGWGGDRYHIYEAEDGKLAFALRTYWDTSAERDEFNAVQATYGVTRFGGGNTDGCYTNEAGALCLLEVGAYETIVTYAPSLALAQALRSSVEGQG